MSVEPHRVLFVCLGNICRSPLAAAVFAHRAAQRGVRDRFAIDSAGTGHWHVGGPADERTLAVARRHGVPIDHTARQVVRGEPWDRFALILAMDGQNRRDLLRLGAPPERVHLMREFDPAVISQPGPDVPDPYTGGDADFEHVFQLLVPACDGVIDHLLARDQRRPTPRSSFTLIELLVSIAIIALLVGLLLPTLAGARQAARSVACSARLQQLGVGLSQYLEDFHDALPQVRISVGNGTANIGALFGGKKGTLPAFGINQYGAERRPLNRYVFSGDVPPDSNSDPFELEPFRSPCDTGGQIPGIGFVRSMYDLLGSSYTLNDHALDGDAFATLIPISGGKMPRVLDTTKTWVLGSHPIYNHQENGDRGLRWYGKARTAANLLFLDFHVAGPLDIPPGVVNTTRDYTFLPRPDWLR